MGMFIQRLGATVAILVMTGVAYASNGIVLQIKDAPLREVLMLLTQQSGCNIIVADDSRMDKRISASLNDVALEKALDYVVSSAGVSYRKTDDGTYIIGGARQNNDLQGKEAVQALAPIVESTAATAVEYAQPLQPETKVVSIKLLHSRPVMITNFLKGSQPRGRVELDSLLGNTSRRSVSPDTGGEPMVPTIDPSRLERGAGRTATERTGAGQIGGYGGGYGGTGGMTGGMGGYGGGMGGLQRGGMGGYGGGMTGGMGGYGGGMTGGMGGYGGGMTGGMGGYGGGMTGGMGGYGGGMTGGMGGYGGGQGGLVPYGIMSMVPFDLENSIMVRGTEEAIQELKEIIRKLDVVSKQVQIKAEFVEVTVNDAKKFGMDWSLDRLNESFSTKFNPGGNVTYGFATGNLTAKVLTELTHSVGRTVTEPMLTTMNNMPASISIGSSIPYWTASSTTSNGVTTTTYSPSTIDISTSLDIMPTINADNSITMEISPQISDQGIMYKGPDGTSIPETRSQSISTIRRIRNGETIVLGGFVTNRESDGYIGVPILCDLPFIGSLFKTLDKNKADVQLLIFLTSNVLDDGSSASKNTINP